jgi:hypothetical protein
MVNWTGVDISDHNGNVDLTKKPPDFLLIRLGYGDNITTQDDKQFFANVKKAETLGKPWGAYIYSYADSVRHIESEVQHCKRMLKGLRPSFPVYFDAEDKALRAQGEEKVTALISLFCEEMQNAGYFTGYYTNLDWIKNHVLNHEKLSKLYSFWYARPGVSNPEYNAPIIQTAIGETGGSWPGCNTSSGFCDIDKCTVDFPSIIKSAGLNGWGSAKISTPVTYVVRYGDSLWGIAVKFHTTVDALERLNPSIENPSQIYAGMKVRVQ